MANANIRLHLREAELWRAAGSGSRGRTSVRLSSQELGRNTGNMVHPPGGTLEVTSSGSGFVFVVQACRARVLTVISFRNGLAYASGVRFATQSARRWLHIGNLWSRRPCKRIPSMRRHRQARLDKI
jgi:hypothetical protein